MFAKGSKKLVEQLFVVASRRTENETNLPTMILELVNCIIATFPEVQRTINGF